MNIDENIFKDDEILQIYQFLSDCIQKIKNPIHISDCIRLQFWIKNNNPTFDQLLKNSIYSKISLELLFKYKIKNISAGTRLEAIKDSILNNS